MIKCNEMNIPACVRTNRYDYRVNANYLPTGRQATGRYVFPGMYRMNVIITVEISV
jgi:hypothetical protein